MHAEALVLDGSMPGEESVSERERDPRINPQPGDVLAVGHDVREVTGRFGNTVHYGFPGRDATRGLSLIGWETWARLADARKVAP
jgi:hypothetical protein